MPKMSTEREVHKIGGPTMGTRWTATIVEQPGLDIVAVEAALAKAVGRVDSQMSTWKPDSDLMRLNTAPPGTWVDLPEKLLQVLSEAVRIGRLSGGAFDIGLGDLVNAWGFGAAGAANTAAIKQALGTERVPSFQSLDIDLSAHRARSHVAPALDLGGIAKGFAVDQMHDALASLGVKNALVSLDGELYAKGCQQDGRMWPVAIEKPDYDARLPLSVIEFQDAAIATSGDYRHWVQVGDIRLAHTMDGQRGGPVQNPVASVTVLAETCMSADAWATALLVMGPENGKALAQEQGLNALFILREENDLRQIPLGPAFAT